MLSSKVWIILGLLVLLIAVPTVVRPTRAVVPDDAARLVIVTPHNEQIRSEFGPAFDAWHRERYGTPVDVVYNVPGGTSEIRKMLLAQAEASLRDGRPVGGNADIVWGGGSYEFSVLKRGATVTVDGEKRSASITTPLELPVERLAEVYGENRIGDQPLYDEAGHWYGTALSGFGVAYNRDILSRLDLDEPRSWEHLCDDRLRGWVALVNPGQSGSVKTAFDAILQRRGWINGWQILRRAGANSRYFSGSSLKPPNDVSRGDAAMGICIDFFGRYQSQAIRAAGGGDRIGYVDPAGETNIDPDPIAMLANAPNPGIAERFIEFVLSEHGQALWQFAASDDGADGLGPVEFELRRMPIRRSMYRDHFERFIDRVDPYEIARPIDDPHGEYRSFIAVLFAAMVMDNHHLLRRAWDAIVDHPAYPGGTIVTAADVSDPTLREMLRLFDELPMIPGPDRPYDLGVVDDLTAVQRGWLGRDPAWADHDLWHRDDRPEEAMRRRFVTFFRDRYRQIEELAAAP